MSRRANPVVIGAFVVGGIVILVAAALWIGSGRVFRHTLSFVSYFEGSVQGLRAGASVKYKGVELGKVSRVRIPYWLQRGDPPIAVFFALDADKLEDVGAPADTLQEAVRGAIGEGLRAQLESDSIVTGVLHVSLAFLPDSEARLHDAIPNVIEIPSVPPPLQELGASVRSLVDRFARYDIEGLLDSMRAAFQGVSDLSRAPELAGMLVALERTLTDLDGLAIELQTRVGPLSDALTTLALRADALGGDVQEGVGSARALAEELRTSVPPLAASLRETSARLQALSTSAQALLDSARALLGTDAPIPVGVRSGVRELVDAARAARELFELLERDPAALLRGKSVEAGTR